MESISDHSWGDPYKAYNSHWYMACQNEGCNALWEVEVTTVVKRTLGDVFEQGTEAPSSS
jgi:hypothetical protein